MSILCDTPQLVEEAIRGLSAGTYIILDCEGKNLGSIDGDISLISLGTPNAEHIYLIEVVALDRNTLKPVLDLISCGEKRKVVWDGRQDYSELYHRFDAPIRNVVDLQIVDVVSRVRRGEGEDKRIWRLATRALPVSQVRNLQTDDVHTVNGLSKALVEHGIEGLEGKDKSVSSMHSIGQSSKWMDRPLSDAMILYASHDVRLIAALYNAFDKSEFLSPVTTFLEQSERYVSIHRDNGRPQEGDIYRSSNVLPLGVLSDTTYSGKPCDKCGRRLRDEQYPSFRRNRKTFRRATCKVCYFLGVREKVERNRVENIARSVGENDYYDWDDSD